MAIALLLLVWGKVILFILVALAAFLSLKDLWQSREEGSKPSVGNYLLVFGKNLLHTLIIAVGIVVVLFLLLLVLGR